MLRDGKLDDREMEVSLTESKSMPMVEIMTTSGMEDMQSSLQDAFSKIFPRKKKKRKMKVPEAMEATKKEEMEKLVDMDKVIKEALRRTEESGIIFLDEIDKIASRGGGGSHGPEVSREGVQRDLLPIVEGATVTTKHGMVKTDHILFIASGAFHMSKPSDLIPELQGRFPDPGGTAFSWQGGIYPDSHRAGKRPDQTICGADEDGGDRAGIFEETPSRKSPPLPSRSMKPPRRSGPAVCIR